MFLPTLKIVFVYKSKLYTYNRSMPLHAMTSPVIYPLRSELARKQHKLATSSGLPSRRSATLFFISVKILSGTELTIAVSINPDMHKNIMYYTDTSVKYFSKTCKNQYKINYKYLPGWIQFTRIAGMICPPLCCATLNDSSAISFANDLVSPTTPPLLAE